MARHRRIPPPPLAEEESRFAANRIALLLGITIPTMMSIKVTFKQESDRGTLVVKAKENGYLQVVAPLSLYSLERIKVFFLF